MTGAPLTAERKTALATLFDQAVQLHARNDVLAAARIYELILKDLPTHADVLDLYGTALFQLGAGAAGRPYVAASLRRRPGHAPAWNHLGAIDRSLHADTAAQLAFRRSIAIDPTKVEPLVNLAATFGDRDAPEEGLRLNRLARTVSPRSPDAALREGVLLSAAHRPQEALPYLRTAWTAQPGNSEIALSLARSHSELGQLAEARRAVMAGIALAPGTHELYGSLAISHDPRFSTDRDIVWARAGTVLRPLDARSWLNLGAETYRDGRIEDAYRAARRTLMLDPASRMGMHNLAAAALNRYENDLARVHARRVLMLAPGNADAEHLLAEVEFRIGDVRTAWKLHEARARREIHRPRLNLPPRWQGPGTETGPLLVASEQGVGDEVTFLACLAELIDEITQPVIIEVDERLVPLAARSFPTATVVPRQLVPGDGLSQFFDYRGLTERYGLRHHILAGSLPHVMDRDRDRGLQRVGYLRTDPDRVARWRNWLSALGTGPKVGVVWRTVQWTRFRARVHCTIEELVPLFAVPGCVFVNLMAGDTLGEMHTVTAATGVAMAVPPGLDLWDDLEDLTALIRALDVVVAARTANCAFAGAVGTPTIRLAQGFLHVSNGREFFFPNVYPVFERDERFDGGEAGRRAAAMLATLTGAADR